VGAAAGRDATVIGANIGVVTVRGAAATTLLIGAEINGCASVAVVTRGRIGRIDASQVGVAAIVSADIGVVAIFGSRAIANSALANIGNGAEVAIVTADVIGYVDTTALWCAAISGADITVITVECDGAFALPKFADIFDGAGASIIARHGVQFVSATRNRMAVISCTNVIVIAIFSPGGQTLTAAAVVTDGARIRVVAPGLVGGMDTGPGVITDIVGARIGVVALLL